MNATSDKWKKHYNMYDYIVKELPSVLKEADLGLVGASDLRFGTLLTIGLYPCIRYGSLYGRWAFRIP